MRRGVVVLVKEAIIVAIATSVVTVGYVFVIPRFFAGLTTNALLVGGLAVAALAGGRVAWAEAIGSEDARFCWAIATGGVAAVVTLFVSLGLIVSFRGA